MPAFGFNENGELSVYAEYSIRGVNTSRDLFPECKKVAKLLKMKGGISYKKVHYMSSKTALIKRVFYDFLMLVFDELTVGGMLVFPGKTGANIALKEMPKETAQRMSREGSLFGMDIVKAQFKVPYYKFDFGPHSARPDRFIRVPEKTWRKALTNAGEGRVRYSYYRKILK